MMLIHIYIYTRVCYIYIYIIMCALLKKTTLCHTYVYTYVHTVLGFYMRMAIAVSKASPAKVTV